MEHIQTKNYLVITDLKPDDIIMLNLFIKTFNNDNIYIVLTKIVNYKKASSYIKNINKNINKNNDELVFYYYNNDTDIKSYEKLFENESDIITYDINCFSNNINIVFNKIFVFAPLMPFINNNILTKYFETCEELFLTVGYNTGKKKKHLTI